MLASLTGLLPTRRESSPRYIVTLQNTTLCCCKLAIREKSGLWPKLLDFKMYSTYVYKLREMPQLRLHVPLDIQSINKGQYLFQFTLSHQLVTEDLFAA